MTTPLADSSITDSTIAILFFDNAVKNTSVFDKVVQWHESCEVKNVYCIGLYGIAYNFSYFAIYLLTFIKIGKNLTKF